ncbi:hypothetical protein NP233_g6806 [Leucocoprinus birnbaumii]|uniref:lytic cellulose monooxygenase (C4-dehydrogenating) n=1 Tax=Leucocoprinus birnbaumii TaxID=56174 RepID=A0AAD5VRG8_9AGAR|nr:hypothetical protein NP233_g6806 [Leucocoprinus birnbaumii]
MFSSRLTLALTFVLSSVTSVRCHGYVQQITNAGNTYTGYLPYTDPYMSPTPERIVRKIPGNGPVTDLSLIDVQCNGYSAGGVVGSAPAPIYATVAAGSQLALNWTTWPDSHVGPMITYMALSPSDITSWLPGTSAVWFKVNEMGKDSSGKWASTDILTANDSIYTFTIPKNLKPGQYIVRHEIIALHAAYTYPGAQVYPSCIQIQVTGSGSAFPTSFVSFPGAYTADTPGIVYDVYTNTSTYFYYVNYPEDGIDIKALVSLIWLLDSIHMAVVAYCIYYYLVTNYNNPLALGIGHWSLFMSVGFNVIIAFVVQCFFTRKIHLLCGPRFKWFITGIISLSVLAHLVFGIETVVYLFIKKELSKLPEITLIAATPFAITAVLSDIFIAGALCWLLHGSKTNFKRTDTIISKLIIYAINRCLLTSVVAIGEVIAFSASPDTLWYLAIDFVIGKLYANSLLATLNSRQSVKAAVSDISGNSVHLSDLEFGSGSSRLHPESRRSNFVDFRYEARTQSSSEPDFKPSR